jgi:hypothetical protein
MGQPNNASHPRIHHMLASVCALALGLVLVGAHGAKAQRESLHEVLIGNKAKPYLEPEGFYTVVFPAGFNCKAYTRQVLCDGNRMHQAHFRIEIHDVPKTATAELVALNAQTKFKKKPHFKVMNKTKMTVDGTPAIIQDMSYDYLGNVQYPVGVKAMYLVRQNKMFVLHFESHLHHFASYAGDLAKAFGSFKPAQLDEGGHPILESLAPPGSDSRYQESKPAESIRGLKKKGWGKKQ